MENLQSMAGVLSLPPILDLIAASSLHEAFLGSRGSALVVNGADVQRLGAQCLQVLMAARAAWAADDQDLVMENCSEEFLAALEMLGITQTALIYRKELVT